MAGTEEDFRGQLPLTEEELLLKSSYLVKIRLKTTDTSAPANESEQQGPKRPKVIKIGPAGPASGSAPSADEDRFMLDFNSQNNVLSTDWDSRHADDNLKVLFENLYLFDNNNFDQKGKNSVVIWATMPRDSERFSLIIASNSSHQIDDERTCIYYKFDASDEGIVQSSRINSPKVITQRNTSVTGFPIERNRQFQLRLVLCMRGIAVYLDGKLLSEYAYKPGIVPNQASFYLICPTVDEESSVANGIIINRVWWGATTPYVSMPGGKKRFAFEVFTNEGQTSPSLAPSKVVLEDAMAERTLFVSGLPTDGSADAQVRRLFEPYQIDSTSDGRDCVAVDGSKGQGVVRVESDENFETAIKFLNVRLPSGYRLSVVPAKKKQVPNWFYC